MTSSITQTKSCFCFSNYSSRCLSRTFSSSSSALSSSITAAGGDDDSPPEAGCPARRPSSMAWAGGAACELAPTAGAIDTLTFGHPHSYAFAHSGHDQFRLRLALPGIDKRHLNPFIFFLAASAPEAALAAAAVLVAFPADLVGAIPQELGRPPLGSGMALGSGRRASESPSALLAPHCSPVTPAVPPSHS